MQRSDFEGIFRALGGRPATIRLLDPPLHEFLPHDVAGQEEVAEVMRVPVDVIRRKVEALHEFNPMLGHRGCRLGITFPEISEMQAQAVMEAACAVHQSGTKVRPEIMIPLVGHVKEFILQRDVVVKVAEDVLKKSKLSKKEVPYLIGTMIEVPRAAVTADEIASEAEFFSFGTNDLTQMGCGFSRDDADRFLKDYIAQGIYEKDPFDTLDQGGVGKLIAMACELGRETRPTIKLGICGEHGGDPASIHFCHKTGLNYVSCSPYRVPGARLAAAHAALDSTDEPRPSSGGQCDLAVQTGPAGKLEQQSSGGTVGQNDSTWPTIGENGVVRIDGRTLRLSPIFAGYTLRKLPREKVLGLDIRDDATQSAPDPEGHPNLASEG
jgi:pyruvate,orthophosphate dikinase